MTCGRDPAFPQAHIPDCKLRGQWGTRERSRHETHKANHARRSEGKEGALAWESRPQARPGSLRDDEVRLQQGCWPICFLSRPSSGIKGFIWVRKVTSAGQTRELGGESLRAVKPSCTSQESWGNSKGSYSSGGVLTRFWLKIPGVLTWGIFHIPVHTSRKFTAFEHLPHYSVTSKAGQVTLWAISVPSRVSMIFHKT